MKDKYENIDSSSEEVLMDNSELSAKRRRRLFAAVISVLVVIMLAFTAASLVKMYVTTTYDVSGTSMLPTFLDGDKVILNRYGEIKHGKVVVFAHGDVHYIKRVIGVAGDHIEIYGNTVYRNGEALTEDYILEPMARGEICDVTVGDGYIFVLGDNRNYSDDSRTIGLVPVSDVTGTVFMIEHGDGTIKFLCK